MRKYLGLLTIFCLVLGFSGCGPVQDFASQSAGGTSTTPVAGAADLAGQLRGVIALRGGAVVRGRVRAQSTLGGVTVRIEDPLFGVLRTVTDAQGAFQFGQVSAGEHTLIVETPGGEQRLPVSVFAGAISSLRTSSVSREQALALVNQALDADPDFFPDRDLAFIAAPHSPLPTGVRLAESLPESETNEPTEQVMDSDKWLVYVDPSTYLRFGHPCRFYLVDAETGAVTFVEASSYPRINGLATYRKFEEFSGNSVATTFPAETMIAPLTVDTVSPRILAQASEDPVTYVLIVDGLDESSSAADLNRIQNTLLPKLGVPAIAETRVLKRPAGSTVRLNLQELCAKTRPQDYLFVYITSHGSRSGVILESGTPPIPIISPRDLFGQPEKTTTETLSWRRFEFGDCRACQVIVILDTCFSEGALSSLPTPRNLDRMGRKWAVLAAAQLRGPSEGNSIAIPSYFIGEETGGLYTTLLTKNAIAGQDPFSVLEAAHAATVQKMANYTFLGRPDFVKKVKNQSPKARFDRAEGEECLDFDLEPSVLNLSHDVVNDPCPNAVGTFTIKNRNPAGATWTAAPQLNVLSVTPSEGTLAAGEEVTVTVTYDCSQSSNFQTGIDLNVSYSGESEQAQVEVNMELVGTPPPPARVSYCPGDTAPVRAGTTRDLFDPFINFFGTAGSSQLAQECPQFIGTFSVSSRSSGNFAVRMTGPPNLPVSFDPCQFELTPGGSQTVRVFFTCDPYVSFNESFTVEASDSNGVMLQEVRIQGTVVRPRP